MFWVIDILVILVTLLVVILGYKKGFLRMSVGFLSCLLVLVLAVALTALFVFLFYKIGVIAQLTLWFTQLLVSLESLLGLANMSASQIAYYLSIIILALILFIISFWIVSLLFKAIRKGVNNIQRGGVGTVIDGVIGAVVKTAVYAAIVFFVFGFVHGVSAGGNAFSGIDEVLRACPVSGLIYEYNPFNSLIAGTGIPEAVAGFLNGIV